MTKSFDKKSHKYLIDGKPATGVTTIIGVLAKPALIQWAANEAVKYIKENASPEWDGDLHDEDKVLTGYSVTEQLLEEARTAHTRKKESAGVHGTDTHELVEQYINTCLKTNEGRPYDVVTPDIYKDIRKFVDWTCENVDHFLFSERQMYDKELFIAGTADFAYIGKDGKKYMADFKTSGGIYGIDYFLQVSAYRMLAENEGDTPYDGMTIVRLGKDGKFEVQTLYEYETYRDAFLCCLKLYRAQASIKDLVIKD